MADLLAFLFIDLAGFTALTEAHGDEDAADLAVRFLQLTEHELGPQDRVVKSIGDAVLVVSPDPAAAIAFCRRVLERIDREPNFPVPRTGIHYGPAAEREGDYFGTTVNLTARIAAQAFGGQVLATSAVADQARTEGVAVVDLGTFGLKNIAEDVHLFELHIGPRVRGAVIDPVCRMRVEMDDAAGRLRVDGVDHWFCSLECAGKFLRDAGVTIG
jgi:class 3 adenylate cyclase/YHS domain-containing protein